MGITHYMMGASPPCRSVLMLAKMINVTLENKVVNILAAEHKSPEFLKINPQGVLPTIDDNGFILWDSHAIMPYLINKYAPESDLYPKDPVKRASIDFMMHFDNGILDKAQRAYFLPVLRMGKDPDPEKEAPFKDALRLFDHFLSNRKFAAGDTLSIADISIVGNLQYAFAMDYDFRTGYDNIKRWWDLVTSPSVNPCYHEINDEPTKQFKEAVKAIKAKFAAAANQ